MVPASHTTLQLSVLQSQKELVRGAPQELSGGEGIGSMQLQQMPAVSLGHKFTTSAFLDLSPVMGCGPLCKEE